LVLALQRLARLEHERVLAERATQSQQQQQQQQQAIVLAGLTPQAQEVLQALTWQLPAALPQLSAPALVEVLHCYARLGSRVPGGDKGLAVLTALLQQLQGQLHTLPARCA
jgi:hypothetical protein